MRWLGGGDAWCERCLRLLLLGFVWVEEEGVFKVGVEELRRERK